MKSVNILLLVFFVAILKVSYSQTEKEKEDIHLKLVEFSNQYASLARFSPLTSETKTGFESNLLELFLSEDNAIVVNDLPIPNKALGKISVRKYVDLALDNFGNSLNSVIKIEETSQKQIFDGVDRWHGDILINKTLSGTIDHKTYSLNIKLKLRVALFNDTFKIISMDSPYDYDADGVTDENDLCRYKPGLISNSGCPDQDGDGIIDPIDLEPNSKQGIKVDKKGIAKGKFWRNATFSIDFTPINYNFISPENLRNDNYSFTSLWNTDYASAAGIVINNPMLYFSNHTIDLNIGFGYSSFTYYYKVLEITNTNTTSVLKYKGYDIPREEGRLNYLTIPLGIRLRNNLYYATIGVNLLIKHNSSSRDGWVYDQGQGPNKANPQKLDGDNNLTESMNNLPISPFIELGLHIKLLERLHLKTGVNYTYLSGFNKNGDAGANGVPHFIGLPKTADLSMHSLSLKVGFTYGISQRNY